MKKILVFASNWLSEALLVVWNYRVIVVALVVLQVALWEMDQGQDLLVNLNDSHSSVIAFYIVISAMATLFWHLPKYLSRSTDARFPSMAFALANVFNGSVHFNPGKPKDINIARMLGVLVFLVPAFAVLNVLEKYGISVPDPAIWFVATAVVYAIMFHGNWIEETYRDKPTSRPYWHAALITCFIATSFFHRFNHGRPADLMWLWSGLGLMSFAFAIAVSIRRHLQGGVIMEWLARRTASRWVMFLSVLLAVAFVAMNLFPFAGIALPLFTISVLLSGLVFYVLLFAFLLIWGRVLKINLALLFLLLALAMAFFSNNPFHEIRLTDRGARQERLDDYVRGWLDHRRTEIAKRKSPYPVFIVNAYGGGIRAAAWTSLVIQRLDSLVHLQDSTDTFQHHLLGYSGASGGTIGASLMCVLRADQIGATHGELTEFYQRDFLSPVLIGLTGRDFFYSTFGNAFSWMGIRMNDRAVLQEKTWEIQVADCFQTASYGEEMTSLYNHNSFEVPLLLSNTTEIKKGLKGILSPVALDSPDFRGAVLVNRLLKEGSLAFSTAAFCSARFPAISPAGKLDTANYFMDGGLKENSGAETARQLKYVVEEIIRADSSLGPEKVRVYLLSLPNTAPSAPEIRRKQIVQLTAPLQALETNWEGNTRVADSVNQALFKGTIFTLRPTDKPLTDEDGPYTAVLPLGWQLSSTAIKRMDQCLLDNEGTINDVVVVIRIR